MSREDLTFSSQLEKEVESWLHEGLISPSQKDQILARYRRLKKVEEKAIPSKLIATIALIGATLIGVGIILFVASNWSVIPKWGKLLMIFVSMLSSYGFGFYLSYEKASYPKIGTALILLGSIIFGAGIFLIAQIYHISANFPNGPLLWGLAALPMAYLLRLKSLLFLAILDLLIWLGLEGLQRLTSSYGSDILAMVPLFCAAGIALWAIGLMHKGWRSFRMISSPYIVLGSSVALFAQFVLTFNLFIGILGDKALFKFYPGIIILFVIAMVARYFAEEKEKAWGIETLGLFTMMGILVYLSIFRLPPSPQEDPLLLVKGKMPLFWNVLFALEILGLIILGYLRRFPIYINMGLLFFVLDVVARYFDFFWELLPRSLFFIAGGVLLLLGGIFLERKRRSLLASFGLGEFES